MAGANYMGGKRNAARARGKDAASKAQRSHFGKKRFEVLRTGLSRSGGVARTSQPQNAGKERPEISLAHARWPQHGPEHGFEARELDYGLRSPFSPVARARSPSVPSSASNRSKILRTLDADSPVAQREQVQRILQMPDLLGLPAVRTCRRARFPSVDRTLSTPGRYEDSFTDERGNSPSSYCDISPLRDQEADYATLASPQAHFTTLPMEAADSGFVPMYLDSSPLDDAQGSGCAECWDSPRDRHSVLANPYKPARISFYPLSDNMGSSLPPRFASPGMPPLPSSHPQLYQQVDTTFFCCSPEPMSPQSQVAASFQLSTPSYLELPPPLARAEFISDLPPQPALESMESPLPPSDLSEFSWHTSSRLLESDDVPQASFTMSPGESWMEEQPFGEHDDDASDGSVYFLPGGRTHPILFDEAEWNGATWDAVCLADFLGGLFEQADPWSTLDDFLDVPSLLPDLPPTSTSLFLLASDRGGVGYVATPRSPDWQDLSSQTLAEETRACTPLFSVSCGTEALEDVPAVDSDPPSSGDTAYDDTPEEAQTYLPRAEYEPLSAPALPSPSPVEMLVKPPGVTVRGPCASIPAAEEDSDVLEEKCGHDASLGTDGADAAVERGIETGVPESFDRDVSVDGPSLFADDDVDLDDE